MLWPHTFFHFPRQELLLYDADRIDFRIISSNGIEPERDAEGQLPYSPTEQREAEALAERMNLVSTEWYLSS